MFRHSAGARSRATAAALLALCLALACTSAPGIAGAAGIAGGNFQRELTEGGSQSSETTRTITTGTTESSGKSGTVVAVVIAIGGALLLGIALVIVRDARRVAPVTDGEIVEHSTPRHTEAALRRRRTKAKAARQQRKRNR